MCSCAETTNRHIKYILSIAKTTNETKYNISNGIIMENTALNGTTTTKDHQGWKKKKNPIIVAVSLALLLGLSFYAGRRGEVGMTNGVASSSSLSLVGSTASLSKVCKACKNDDNCLKTCTCGKDADCPQWFPPTITTCDQKKCVTHSRSPWSF